MPKDDATIRIKVLFEKYLQNKCSSSELAELWQCLAAQEKMEQLDPLLNQLWQSSHPEDLPADHLKIQQKASEILNRSRASETSAKFIESGRKKQNRLKWLAAAAVIFLALGAGAFLWINGRQDRPADALRFNAKNMAITPVYPTDRAMLMLADGKTIDLNHLAEGDVVDNSGNGVKIQKTGNGQITYDFQQSGHSQNTMDKEQALNQLTTPSGQQFQIVLADGTRVWLNGLSSIRFPSHFSGQQRTVAITGEAYFEVAHDAKKPFTVHAKGMDIQVLGTHFNVNAYQDEPTIRTTLLEGLVRIQPLATTDKDHNKAGKAVILHPGQQLNYNGTGKANMIRAVDLDAVMSWKQGKFIFQNEDMGVIMRSIARWYNIKVEYEDRQIPEGHVSGEISRSETLSQVLKMLELAEGARFEVRGKTVIVHSIQSSVH